MVRKVAIKEIIKNDEKFMLYIFPLDFFFIIIIIVNMHINDR